MINPLKINTQKSQHYINPFYFLLSLTLSILRSYAKFIFTFAPQKYANNFGIKCIHIILQNFPTYSIYAGKSI
jgi:hypothetical protein